MDAMLSKAVLDAKISLKRLITRVNKEGKIVENALPESMGNDLYPHPYYSVVALEPASLWLKTPSLSNLETVDRYYRALQHVLIAEGEEGEIIWPLATEGRKTVVAMEFSFLNEFENERDFSQFAEEVRTKHHEILAHSKLLSQALCAEIEVGQYALTFQVEVNPFEFWGVSVESLEFIHLYLLALVNIEETFNDEAAILSYIQSVGESFRFKDDVKTLIDQFIESFEKSQTEIDHAEKSGTLAQSAYERALFYRKKIEETPYHLQGFVHMEMSFQNFFYDMIRYGVEVELIDEVDNFARLTLGDHVEFVQNSNRSSKVSYINSIIMENKFVTKYLLAEAGYSVPEGRMYQKADDAKRDFWRYAAAGFVVKPKTTNAGIGISVFKEKANQEAYEEAVEIAFAEDQTILVEEYAEGKEYRFHILGGKCVDVLYREPANVVGDGKQTIEELVELKNKHPYRGENNLTPLIKIKIGQIERLMLKQNGYTPQSIPAEGEQVFLRENSNISTGGDSIVMTSQMHESYKRISEGIAETLGTPITGVDMIIPDINQESTVEEPGYTVIETNANPGMFGHIYISSGLGTRLSLLLLDTLFPELQVDLSDVYH